MKIELKSFTEIFETSFWKKLEESIVPFDSKPNKNDFINELFNEISNYTYNPSNPREYIVMNKHNGISRYIPTFDRKDYCVYYFCIKLLEEEIAVNRVDGTFGGWSLGNPIRLKEENEVILLDYIPYNTLNPLSWIEQWNNFQNIAYKYRNTKDWKCYINIDIANFYDCVNLSILERKIRHVVPKIKQEIVTLLFHFLRNWNKKLEGYNIKTVGLPQDEIGDCSRVLANFYLQDYDKKMNEICKLKDAQFLRFADDQIIYSHSMEDAKYIMFEASRELLRVNLNLNSSKVKIFHSTHEFDEYWAFEIFELLENDDKESINKAVKKFLLNLDANAVFRDASVLKRLLKIDFKLISPENRHLLLSKFFNPEFLSTLNEWHLKKIREKVDNDKEFFEELDNLIKQIPYNSFHYNLLSFYEKVRSDFNFQVLLDRIKELKL